VIDFGYDSDHSTHLSEAPFIMARRRSRRPAVATPLVLLFMAAALSAVIALYDLVNAHPVTSTVLAVLVVAIGVAVGIVRALRIIRAKAE
jgi:hypothetical protein